MLRVHIQLDKSTGQIIVFIFNKIYLQLALKNDETSEF